MMERIDALKALLEKVEVGDYDYAKYIIRDLAKDGVFDPDEYGWALKAYKGSLDAAKSLHEAVLPEYTRDVDATAPECGIDVRVHSYPHGFS